jgi:hypothetical protein
MVRLLSARGAGAGGAQRARFKPPTPSAQTFFNPRAARQAEANSLHFRGASIHFRVAPEARVWRNADSC